jgi:RNA polymerase sigma factor (sigma-70 family)
MATTLPGEVIQRLRRPVLLQDGAGLTDEQLLEAYVSRRDEVALEALVQRHAPMVWCVCRRTLRNQHDAEDAFQATFLVFVRKAASIASRELLANWLYGVAYQTARKARATAARRRARERQVTQMPEPALEQETGDNLQLLLDRELSQLADKYRTVIILCDLEGMTRKEAARQLRCPEGTVASRLATARTMLAKRLTRHGLAVTGGALAAAFSQSAALAGMPPSVVSSTIKAATLFAAGQASADVISAHVAALAEGVLKAMMLTKLKTVVAVVLLLGFSVIVTGATIYSGGTAADGATPVQPIAEERAKTAQKQEQKQEKEVFTAWGKEVDGLQAGAALVKGDSVRIGEKATVVVKLRNLSKAPIKVSVWPFWLYPPGVVDAADKSVRATRPPIPLFEIIPKELTLPPGQTVDLSKTDIHVAGLREDVSFPAGVVDQFTIHVLPGKYKAHLEGFLQGRPSLSTGAVEFEVSADPPPSAKKTPTGGEGNPPASGALIEQPAWGKPSNGLRLGLYQTDPNGDGKSRLNVVLENVSNEDLVLILGDSWARGKKHQFGAMGLNLTTAEGMLKRSYDLRPKGSKQDDLADGAAAGPFVVQLVASGRYTISSDLHDYYDPKDVDAVLAPGKYRAAAKFVGQDYLSGWKSKTDKGPRTWLDIMTYWTGTVESGVIQVTVPAKPAK